MNINNVSSLLGEDYSHISDYFDEPPLFITWNIKFSDNKWDLSDETHKNIVFYFSSIESDLFRVLTKKVVLRLLFLVGLRNSTVIEKFKNIRNFIHFLEKEQYMNDLRFLTPGLIEQYIEGFKEKGRTKGYLSKKLSSIKELLKEAEISGIDIDLSHYKDVLTSISWDEIKAEIVNNKTPNIPKRVFNKLVETALRVMDDECLRINERMIACLIIILSHTGMRRGELQLLEVDKLKDITILSKEVKAYILNFYTYKTTSLKNGRWTKTIAFPNTVKAYQTLEMLSAERRLKGDTKYLFVNSKGKRYSNTSFVHLFDLFFYRHQELFNDLTEFEKNQVHHQTLSPHLMKLLGKRELSNCCTDERFYTLNPHQFRVAFANKLKGKVSLQWIREHMNHLDEEMTKHYFRDDEVVKQTLFKRASSHGDSIGIDYENQNSLIRYELSEPELKKAYSEINKFLRKKKLNIFKDIDEILSILKYNPLRENIVGVCTKHLGILCDRQYRLATLERWYYLSPTVPNIESFDFTYKRFLDKAKIVQHNKQLVQNDSKYQRDYDNEYTALIKFFQNRLLPEYELVVLKLNDEGKESMLTSLPQLEGIISNIDEVSKEISNWISRLRLENT